MPVDRLFVYGTLMQGLPLHHLLTGEAQYLGRGRVRGRLVSLGEYPGLIDGTGWVYGEVYRAERPELLWPLLDEAEGFNPRAPAAGLFIRKLTDVTIEPGETTEAWVYRYNGPLGLAQPIPSGDFRRHWTPAHH